MLKHVHALTALKVKRWNRKKIEFVARHRWVGNRRMSSMTARSFVCLSVCLSVHLCFVCLCNKNLNNGTWTSVPDRTSIICLSVILVFVCQAFSVCRVFRCGIVFVCVTVPSVCLSVYLKGEEGIKASSAKNASEYFLRRRITHWNI